MQFWTVDHGQATLISWERIENEAGKASDRGAGERLAKAKAKALGTGIARDNAKRTDARGDRIKELV